MKKPILYIMIGLPAAGKSTFAERIPHANVISADKVRGEWFGDEGLQYTEDLLRANNVDFTDLDHRERERAGSAIVWKEVHRRIFESLDQGTDTVLDGINVTRRLRDMNMQTYSEKAFVCGVFFDCDPELCIARDAKRSRVVGEQLIRSFAASLEKPEMSEGFDALYTFDGYGKLERLELKPGVPKELFPE